MDACRSGKIEAPCADCQINNQSMTAGKRWDGKRRQCMNTVQNKRILLVSTRQFWPIKGGKECTLFHYCKGLHEQYHYQIYVFCFADALTDKTLKKPDFIQEVIYVDVPKVYKSFGNLLGKSIFGSWPIQCSLYYRKNIGKLIADYYNKVKPEVVFIDMVRLSPYIKIITEKNVKKVWC